MIDGVSAKSGTVTVATNESEIHAYSTPIGPEPSMRIVAGLDINCVIRTVTLSLHDGGVAKFSDDMEVLWFDSNVISVGAASV